jgi:hypothetical protein
MFVNDLILNACVKMTEMFICEKILTTSVKKLLPNHTLTDRVILSNLKMKKKHLKLLYEHVY